jgi:hypothetical protein
MITVWTGSLTVIYETEKVEEHSYYLLKTQSQHLHSDNDENHKKKLRLNPQPQKYNHYTAKLCAKIGDQKNTAWDY